MLSLRVNEKQNYVRSKFKDAAESIDNVLKVSFKLKVSKVGSIDSRNDFTVL